MYISRLKQMFTRLPKEVHTVYWLCVYCSIKLNKKYEISFVVFALGISRKKKDLGHVREIRANLPCSHSTFFLLFFQIDGWRLFLRLHSSAQYDCVATLNWISGPTIPQDADQRKCMSRHVTQLLRRRKEQRENAQTMYTAYIEFYEGTSWKKCLR